MKDVPVYGRSAGTREVLELDQLQRSFSTQTVNMILNKTASVLFISVQKSLQKLDNTGRCYFSTIHCVKKFLFLFVLNMQSVDFI